jgi:hypothetical protein
MYGKLSLEAGPATMNDPLPVPVTLGLAPSFGFGDRTGLATPGHVASMNRCGDGIEAIYPQQSIREMSRTSRSPSDVMDDALTSMVESGWVRPTGADADHLKTHEDVDVTAAVGFTFFTIDPSDHVDTGADDYSLEELHQKFLPLADQVDWIDRYQGRQVTLDSGTVIELDQLACLRAAVKYGTALAHALELAAYIETVHASLGRDFEIELSVDETPQPTTLAEHYIIADQCLEAGMKLISLAPRFIGDFEKGVDYKGDVAALEASLHDHADIARKLGPYKLSLHSGSDKLSMYPALARATGGCYHVKTAGTSYLEALRVVARHDEALFRQIIRFARERYNSDKATYHVAATLDSAPPADDNVDLRELERQYLEIWDEVPEGTGFTAPGRQILHCTFGSVLTDQQLGAELRDLLVDHPGTYCEVLDDHFGRHLDALRAGM